MKIFAPPSVLVLYPFQGIFLCVSIYVSLFSWFSQFILTTILFLRPVTMCSTLCSCAMPFQGLLSVCFNICKPFFLWFLWFLQFILTSLLILSSLVLIPIKIWCPKWGNCRLGEKIKARWALLWKLCFAILFPTVVTLFKNNDSHFFSSVLVGSSHWHIVYTYWRWRLGASRAIPICSYTS